MIDIYGTLGPSCSNFDTLVEMYKAGMTGMRLNLSHMSLTDCCGQIEIMHEAARRCNITSKLLIDMQGPELRIGKLECPMKLVEGSVVMIGENGIPFPQCVLLELKPGQQILLDDGKILLEVIRTDYTKVSARVIRSGILNSRKSIALPGLQIDTPTLTDIDIKNISVAKEFGVTAIMQPFVRGKEDLITVRNTLDEYNCQDIRILAKIENMEGVTNLVDLLPFADEIVIARGDLGNAVPLWELPRVQKEIEKECRKANKPFMVVTQMLTSMEHNQVPTRAEVSDIFNAICDLASSVMVTGETAVGEYPVDVIKYLKNTVASAERYINRA